MASAGGASGPPGAAPVWAIGGPDGELGPRDAVLDSGRLGVGLNGGRPRLASTLPVTPVTPVDTICTRKRPWLASAGGPLRIAPESRQIRR